MAQMARLLFIAYIQTQSRFRGHDPLCDVVGLPLFKINYAMEVKIYSITLLLFHVTKCFNRA